ncbi:MAG: group I intron-associated PD-(D/E)XK endonuclease [Solirubrobacteraceae bacterium]
MTAKLSPREQGDIGERAAAVWLLSNANAYVFFPFGHSPDFDLVADMEGRLVRVQVKTSTVHLKNGRYEVTLATRGGNRSWNGLVKRFSSSRCDFLFVLVADGRQWFIPAADVEGGSAIIVGGPKYAAYEVDPGQAIATMRSS